jgi:hypothetical protein
MSTPLHVQQIERQLRSLSADALRQLAAQLSRAAWHTERGRPAEALSAIASAAELLERSQ